MGGWCATHTYVQLDELFCGTDSHFGGDVDGKVECRVMGFRTLKASDFIDTESMAPNCV